MPSLFVPLATAGGNPKKMSTGSVNKEPPPAMVFINPAMKPTNINNSKLKSKSNEYPMLKYMKVKSINKQLKAKLKIP